MQVIPPPQLPPPVAATWQPPVQIRQLQPAVQPIAPRAIEPGEHGQRTGHAASREESSASGLGGSAEAPATGSRKHAGSLRGNLVDVTV